MSKFTKNKFEIIIAVCLILVITFAAFSSSLNNGFTNWDDDVYVTNNSLIKDLTWGDVKRIFTPSSYTNLETSQLFVPVVFLSYSLEYHFFKLNAFIYHATNLIFHLLNCILVFWLIFLLSRNIWVAFVTTILFSVHPLRVESVAWITERKDMMCAFFFLVALICYTYYLKQRRKIYYYFSILVFILALLSKPLAIALPFVLFFCDYFINGRISKNNYLEKIIFFIIILAYFSIYMFHSEAYASTGPTSTFWEKILMANYAIVFYLYKLILPFRLSCLYPHPLESRTSLSLAYLFYCFLTIFLFSLALFSRKYTKKVMLGSIFFLVTIIPALLIVSSHTIVADRFTYLPSIGVFFIVAEGVVWLYRKKIKHYRIKQVVILMVLACICGFLSSLTWKRCYVWKDNITLWNDVLKNYPNVATAYNSRGTEFLLRKEYKKAYSDFTNTLNIDPTYSEAYFNMGSLYYSQGNYQEAVKSLNKALQIDPGYLEAYNMLVSIYSSTGQHFEVINTCKEIIKIKNNNIQAYINLSSAYGNLGNFPEAIVYGGKAIAIDPKSGLAYMNMAAAYFAIKKYDLAIKYCDMAIALGYEVSPKFLEMLKAFRKIT
jgi:protein O-mannosyl-transferase